jgi:hypothetical protein
MNQIPRPDSFPDRNEISRVCASAPARICGARKHTPKGEILSVHPHCLTFFSDETGHEDFADRNYPVFGIGGCAVLAPAIEQNLRIPWRTMKERYFGGADLPLHAANFRNPTPEQVQAIADFFRNQEIGRFAVTMTASTKLPDGLKPIQIMPGALRRRWEELTPRFVPLPVETAFIHEASDRGDELLPSFGGIRSGRASKLSRGNQARHGIVPGQPVRRCCAI